VPFQVDEFHVEEFQVEESKPIVFHVDEFQVEEFQVDEFHVEEFHVDESHDDAIVVVPVEQVAPGRQTSAGTPWLARPIGVEMLYVAPTSSCTIDPPCTIRARSARVYLTSSGLQSGCCWKRIAAAPATCGAANEVPLIFA
jgi:hypothetical protein